MKLIALALALILVPCLGAATEVVNSNVSTLTYQDGVLPASDSDFFEDTYICSAAADSGLNHGAADTLRASGVSFAGTFKSAQNKILIKFDVLGALPDSAEIIRARLLLYQVLGSTGASPVDSLEILSVFPDWTEGTGDNDGTAQAASADWNNYTALEWSVAGVGDLVADKDYMKQWTGTDNAASPTFVGDDTASVANSALVGKDATRFSSSVFIAKSGTANTRQGWVGVDLTREARQVQRGVRPVLNVLIQVHNVPTSTRQVGFASSEHPDEAIRPKMEFEFVDLTDGLGGGVKTTVGPGRRP
jgi:hypothetical protein